MTKKQIYRLLLLFIVYLLASLIISYLIFKWTGRQLSWDGNHLDLDFFNCFCGVVTVLGFGIAIYQIAALRSEQEINWAAETRIKEGNFVKNAIVQTNSAKKIIEDLYTEILYDTYEEKIIIGYIDKLSQCISIFNNLDNQQTVTKSSVALDCKNCVTLMSEIKTELFRVVEDSSYITFKRQHFHKRVESILSKILECDSKLNI